MRFLRLRKHWYREAYSITDDWFSRVVDWAGITPTVDALASKQNMRLPNYWTAHHDAFQKCWKWDILWMNPPFSKLNQVLEKILRDEAQGILLIPVWPSRVWFHALSRLAVKWWDLPRDQPIFMSEAKRILPP